MTDVEQQILTLRALTATTGAIHEAQLLQMKQWGAIAFHHLKPGKWEALVDVESKTLTYKLQKAKRPAKMVFARTLACLDESIHWLLGPDWALTVEEDGNLIYNGKRTTKDTAGERKQRAGAGKSEKPND